MEGSITDVPGFLVGHEHALRRGSGITVLLFPRGAMGAADIRGEAAGTRQMDSLLRPHPESRIHALVLAGGGAFGLDAPAGGGGCARGGGGPRRGGFGPAGERAGGALVGACAVVNAFGDVFDPLSGEWLAGARTGDGKGRAGTEEAFLDGYVREPFSPGNTTLAVVATPDDLSREELIGGARMAQGALFRPIGAV